MRPLTAARVRRWRLLLARVAAAVLFLLAVAQPAHAAYPCPNGPGPGEIQVGMADGGHGIATLPMCNRVGGADDAPGDLGAPGGAVMVPRGATYTYGSIAWHADAGDVWMVGNSGAASSAEREALAACNRAMGGGCTAIGTWHNSAMKILRDRHGGLISAWDGDGGEHSARALAACTAATKRRCAILARVGNGVIQPYRLGDDNEQSATVETSAKRAAQAAQVNCERQRQRCDLQRSYDSRIPGAFVHDFNAATAP